MKITLGLALLCVAVLGAGCFEDRTILRRTWCGNGELQDGEQCDDNNVQDGDGCSATCTLEAEADCADGIDDDGDGLVDCADPDCDTDPACAPVCGNGVVEGSEECDDGNVEDRDGCSSTCTLEVASEICNDGVDNDLDGLVDCADPDCAGPACAGPETQCSDRVDNDGDGLVDCDDPDCTTDPSCAVCGNGVLDPGEECDDANADDYDGCTTTCLLSEHCSNGSDDDLDGLVDCADPDCIGAPGC